MKKTVPTLLTAGILSLSLVFSLTAYSSGFPSIPSSASDAAAQASKQSAIHDASITDAGLSSADDSRGRQESWSATDGIDLTDDIKNSPSGIETNPDGAQAAPHADNAGKQVQINAAGTAFAGKSLTDEGRSGIHTGNVVGNKNAILPAVPLWASLAGTLAPPGIGRAGFPIAASSARPRLDVIPDSGKAAGAAAVKAPAGSKRLTLASFGLKPHQAARPSNGTAAGKSPSRRGFFANCFTRAPPMPLVPHEGFERNTDKPPIILNWTPPQAA